MIEQISIEKPLSIIHEFQQNINANVSNKYYNKYHTTTIIWIFKPHILKLFSLKKCDGRIFVMSMLAL